jgi:hypothetical protein
MFDGLVVRLLLEGGPQLGLGVLLLEGGAHKLVGDEEEQDDAGSDEGLSDDPDDPHGKRG